MPEYLKNLTPEQYIAATEISGPMMVIAGPGTGKTQVLSSRIAHILSSTDTQPQNILVLTFTDSGTVAVRKRLQNMIGSAAYYVGIYTFHSFAESIIESYKDHFGNMGDEVISNIDQITLIRKILDETALERLKIIDDPYFYTRDILRNISTLKRENVSPKRLKELTSLEIEELKNTPENFNKRTQKLKVDIETRIKSLEKSIELADVYEKYEINLKESKRHDYDDMITTLLDKIKNNPDLKSDLQERYQYFLVDEYQDTNGAQNQIVTQLTSYYDNPDLFVVGDDDQSIYRFQGASLANIMYFHKQFPDAKTVIMTKSHRSTQKILDTSMQVIQNNTERLTNKLEGIEKKLFSYKVDNKSKVVLANFETGRHENLWIVEKIQDLIKEGYEYSDIVILFRNNYEIEELSLLLLLNNIPVTSDKSSNILDDEDIRNFLTLMRCIANPYDDRLFYAVICQTFSHIDPLDRIKISNLRQKKKTSFFEISKDIQFLIENNIGFSENISILKGEVNSYNLKNNNQFELFDKTIDDKDNIQNSFINFTNFLIKQNQVLNSESFIVFFDKLLKEVEFTDRIFEKENRISKLNKISTLFDEIKHKTSVDKNYNFDNFFNYINIVEEYNVTITEKALDLSINSVKLMTAHKSKGLEFPIVFIPKSIDKYWGNNSNRQNIALPENIIGNFKPSKDEKNEEERRLFYVGLTRAKSQIYVSYANEYENLYGKKATMPSMFVNEMGKDIEIINPKIVISEEDIIKELNTSSLSSKKDESLSDDLKPEEMGLITQMVDNLKMNSTALNNYLECPRKFYYNNLLHIPQLRTDKQSFGTAMHKALELFYDEYSQNKILPSLEFLIDKFEIAFDKEWTSEEGKERLMIEGRKGLEGYYNQIILKTSLDTNVIFTELNFDKRNVYLDDLKITGKIDTIIQNKTDIKNEAEVVDYKTGRIRSSNEIQKFTTTSEGNLIPSAYYSQLMFYKILTDNDKTFKYNIKAGILDFIEGKNNKYKQEVFEYKIDEIDAFKTLIKETVKEIKKLKFGKIKKGKTCSNCAFNKICWGG